MVFPVIRQALVERRVLFGGDIAGVTRPDGFCLVELLIGGLNLLDLLCLLVLGLVVLVIDLLDLRLVFSVLGLGCLFFIILNFLQETVRSTRN